MRHEKLTDLRRFSPKKKAKALAKALGKKFS